MDPKRTPKITFFLDQYELKSQKKNEVWKQQQNSRS